MAPTVFQLIFLCIFLFSVVVLPIPSHADSSEPKPEKTSSPFEFIKHLQGCHKGEKVKGLHELKTYLEKFGYLNYHHQSQNQTTHVEEEDDNYFDDLLESAVKTYQLNYHLKATGTLDAQTVADMMKPRCGVPDIINGTNSMRAGKKRHHHHGHDGPGTNDLLHTVKHYAFIDPNLKWPPSQTHLTYGFPPGTDPRAVSAVARAFDQWASATHFTFSQAQGGNANLRISFHRGDHGDGYPFDGRGGTIAHAFPPSDGRFHYDADEPFSVGASPGAFDLETVALHEIGHLLGLGHSSVQDAIMFASISPGVTKGLHGDDIQGIKALYNV